MLKINNLSAGYQKEKMILNNFNLELNAGERVGIIGQNGCGKSTLAKSIMGLVPYTKGKVEWQAQANLLKLPPYEKDELGIAYFMQGGRVFGNLSVLENLKIAWLSNKKNTTFAEDILMLQNFDLPLFADKRRLQLPAENLSGGEKHILSFGMVLLGCPNMKLLIADEPSAGVAQIGQKQILNLLSHVLAQKNIALLLIEQNRDFLNELTNKTVEIKTN